MGCCGISIATVTLNVVLAANYVKRSIEVKRPSGSFHIWRSRAHALLAEKRQLPVYSRRLREAREAYDISQRNLGIKVGLDEFVASTRINRYEKGVYQPNLHIQQELAQALELPLAYFYAEDDELARLIREFKSKSEP